MARPTELRRYCLFGPANNHFSLPLAATEIKFSMAASGISSTLWYSYSTVITAVLVSLWDPLLVKLGRINFSHVGCRSENCSRDGQCSDGT